MAASVPVVYLLHGEDDFAIQEFLKIILDKMGDPSMAEMNTTHMEGSVSLERIREAAMAVPFLTQRRLVIVEDLAQYYKPEPDQKRLLEMLDSLPQTCALTIIERKTLKDNHWLLKWTAKAGGRAYVRAFEIPQGARMADWIRKYAVEQGGELTFQAASLLAENVQDAPRMAVMEVDKLLAYVDYQRPIDVEDVDAAGALGGGQADYFAFLDAIAARNGRAAMNLLERLLDEREGIALFFSLVGHFRLVLQAREIYDRGGQADTVAKLLDIHPYRAKKILMQARNIPLAELEKMYLRLQQLDLEIKTGQVDANLALETLVLELVGG